MSIERYIENLKLDAEIGTATRSDVRAFEVTPPDKTIPDDLDAAVNAGSLLSFVAGIDRQEVEDVLYSVQLAQRAASGTYDRFTQIRSWYQKYMEVLENLGWVSEQLAFAAFDQGEGKLRMDKAALSLIMAVATQNQLGALKAAVDALEGLAENDRAIQLFDFQSSVEKVGNFQIGSVQKSDNGSLSMALGAFYFHCNDSRRKFLFFSWGQRTVNFWTAAQKTTLNATLYEPLRELVKKKVGASAPDYIASLRLP